MIFGMRELLKQLNLDEDLINAFDKVVDKKEDYIKSELEKETEQLRGKLEKLSEAQAKQIAQELMCSFV